MAPTETLAEQHLATLDRLLGGLVPIELLTGSTSAARRRELLARLASGELSLVVGTHALIEEAVEFRDLAVCVVDEQHRFGVRQRAALDAKAADGLAPHALHMTATPIPRTLALTAYGDLDATVLRELPAGRHPVETHVVDGARARQPRLRAHPRGDRRGAAVLRRLPARRGVGGAPGQGGDGRVRATARDRVPRAARGAHPRAAAARREAAGDGGLRRRRGRRPGGHQRDRGRNRRAQRVGDADRGGRALRALPAPPAARPGRSRSPQVAAASSSATPSCRGSRRSPASPTASASPRSTSSCAGRGRSSAPASTACPSSAWRACPTTPTCSSGPAPAPTSSADLDDPLLRDAVDARFGSELEPIPA